MKSTLRIVGRAPVGSACFGQDVKVYLVRPDGTEIDLTRELHIKSLRVRSGEAMVADLQVVVGEVDVMAEASDAAEVAISLGALLKR